MHDSCGTGRKPAHNHDHDLVIIVIITNLLAFCGDSNGDCDHDSAEPEVVTFCGVSWKLAQNHVQGDMHVGTTTIVISLALAVECHDTGKLRCRQILAKTFETHHALRTAFTPHIITLKLHSNLGFEQVRL